MIVWRASATTPLPPSRFCAHAIAARVEGKGLSLFGKLKGIPA